MTQPPTIWRRGGAPIRTPVALEGVLGVALALGLWAPLASGAAPTTVAATPDKAAASAAAPAAAAGQAAPARAAPAGPAAPAAALTPEEASQLIGMNFGTQLRGLGVNDAVVLEGLSRGLKEGLAGKRISPEDQRRLQAFVRAAVEAAVAHNLDAAQAFLARNATDKSVRTTASGLQYKILAAGDPKAASPTLADQVTVHYRGTLLDGSEFDSSYSRGEPATFPLGGVIKGWQEALPLMKPGAKWKLFIPPALGYGSAPRPEIPGGSLLTFDVQLISVQPAAAPPAPTGPAPAQR